MTLNTILSKLSDRYSFGTIIASLAVVVDATDAPHAKARAEKRNAVALLKATADAVDKILTGDLTSSPTRFF